MATGTPGLQAAAETTRVKNAETQVESTLTLAPYPVIDNTLAPYPGMGLTLAPYPVMTNTLLAPISSTWTPADTPTRTPTNTPTLSRTAIIQTIAASYPAETRASFPSSDGKWRVDVIVYNEFVNNACPPFEGNIEDQAETNSYEVLVLVDRSDGSRKFIQDDFHSCGGMGTYGLDGLFWSANNRYFYYTDAAFGVPDGGCIGWQRPITRLEVTSLKTESRTGKLSPGRDHIAAKDADGLLIWDTNSDQTTHLAAAASEGFILSLTWSPDGQAIAYLQMVMDPTAYCVPAGKTSVVRVDLSSLKQEVVLVIEAPGYTFILWDAPNHLRLFEPKGPEWGYTLVTQELTKK